jgi:hypothetical protein
VRRSRDPSPEPVTSDWSPRSTGCQSHIRSPSQAPIPAAFARPPMYIWLHAGLSALYRAKPSKILRDLRLSWRVHLNLSMAFHQFKKLSEAGAVDIKPMPLIWSRCNRVLEIMKCYFFAAFTGAVFSLAFSFRRTSTPIKTSRPAMMETTPYEANPVTLPPIRAKSQ